MKRVTTLLAACSLSAAWCPGAFGQVNVADVDNDLDSDLRDAATFQACFSGSIADPGFVALLPECLPLDIDQDGDIDLDDYAIALCALGGPNERLVAVQLDVPTTLTRSRVVKVVGSSAGWPMVERLSDDSSLQIAVASCSFATTLELKENRKNIFHFRGLLPDGTASPAVPVQITHDEQPPDLFIDVPQDNAEILAESTDVAGRVSDMLSGFNGLRVWVNGRPAEVDIGIGTNGTFLLPQLRLNADGPTAIEVVALDALGNEARVRISVTRREPDPSSPRISSISGNTQTGVAGQVLPNPIVVQVRKADGSPFVNKIVTFRVARSNGRLTSTPEGLGTARFQTHTNAKGEARAFWRLGSDAGCGNNRVAVTSVEVASTASFCASATEAPPSQINIGVGNNQRVEIGGPAPEPLRVWVNDACNGVAGVPVTFTVTQGDGQVDGESEVTVLTGATGHAEVHYVLGTQTGNNFVAADFPGNPNLPAEFVLFGVERGDSQPTSFSGLVLDNAGRPIEGATCTLSIVGHPPLESISNIEGQFSFLDLTASGKAHLHVNGQTATHVGGVFRKDIPAGTFPFLAYETVVIPNAANSLPTPVLLPPLNPANARVYDGTQDVELSVQGVEGLRVLVEAGTRVELPTGDCVDPADAACTGEAVCTGDHGSPCVKLSLDQVHHDDIPMPMPDGAAPPYAGTMQPGGAVFDPPARIVYPNMYGLPPGLITNFMSFNHDTHQFEIIATGPVSEDGSTIVSDPGSGIRVAGWHCNCPPYSVTGDCCFSATSVTTAVTGPGSECCPQDCGPCGRCVGGACELCEPPDCCLDSGQCLALRDDTCADRGSITGGSVDVTPQDPVLGQVITFELVGAYDTGGSQIVCNDGGPQSAPIGPVALSVEYELITPDGEIIPGSGAAASIRASILGAYTCRFKATAPRKCDPPEEFLDGTATVECPDLELTPSTACCGQGGPPCYTLYGGVFELRWPDAGGLWRREVHRDRDPCNSCFPGGTVLGGGTQECGHIGGDCHATDPILLGNVPLPPYCPIGGDRICLPCRTSRPRIYLLATTEAAVNANQPDPSRVCEYEQIQQIDVECVSQDLGKVTASINGAGGTATTECFFGGNGVCDMTNCVSSCPCD